MVVTAGGQEHRLPTVGMRHREPKHVAMEAQRPLQVGHHEVDMADANAGMDGN